MAETLETRLTRLEEDLAEQHAAWFAEVYAAFAACGTPAEVAAFDRAISRSLGEMVEDGDPEADDRTAAELFLRIPPNSGPRGAILFPVENS